MNDTGATVYTGTIPNTGTATAGCALVLASVQETQALANTCVYPSGAGSCSATLTGHLLSGFTSTSTDVPTSSSQVVIKVTLELAATAVVGVIGLDLRPELSIADARPSWSASLAYSSEVVEL
jgi:hypothetical protein